MTSEEENKARAALAAFRISANSYPPERSATLAEVSVTVGELRQFLRYFDEKCMPPTGGNHLSRIRRHRDDILARCQHLQAALPELEMCLGQELSLVHERIAALSVTAEELNDILEEIGGDDV